MSVFASQLTSALPDPEPPFGKCDFGHGPVPLHQGVCAEHLAYLYRDPFVIRRARRTWRQTLAHWWRSYRWIGAGLAALAAGLFFTGLVAAFVLLALCRHGVIG